ncbi:hypothetical protein L6R49_09655 [Myxococcota bacterium]|nr:hypothetical protein [Myxococcota bacterium]
MAVDPELLEELRALAPGLGVVELAEADAAGVIRRARATFVTRPRVTWWWTALRPPTVTLPYGGQDGLTLLVRLLPAETRAVLVVTDDEPPPWPTFEGAIGDLVALLRELRPFELWLSAREADWIVFDTHHDALVVAGPLVAAAQSVEASR